MFVPVLMQILNTLPTILSSIILHISILKFLYYINKRNATNRINLHTKRARMHMLL